MKSSENLKGLYSILLLLLKYYLCIPSLASAVFT